MISGWIKEAKNIELVFTATITFATITYALISRGQLTQMSKANALTGDTIILQKQTAKVAYGVPRMDVSDVELFHQNESRKVWAYVAVADRGKTYADKIQVAILMDILPSAPTKETRYDFSESKFEDTTPNRLQPIENEKDDVGLVQGGTVEMRRQVSTEQYMELKASHNDSVYVWGVIRYKDFIGDNWNTTNFCKVFPVRDVLGFPNQKDGGYRGPNRNCD